MSDANGSQDWADKKIFTTGEAAQVCKVSQQTIIRCFDSGRLTGFRVPGSRFRRIPREELLRFMRENDIPTSLLEPGLSRVLIVDDDPEIVRLMTEWLESDGRFEIRSAGTGYDAGLETERFRPSLIVLDYMLPDINGNIVCQRVRGTPELTGTKILCVSGVVEADEVENLRRAGADDFLKKPFDLHELVTRIEHLLDMEARTGR
ncbi:MAG: response regulator [Phycisphaerales bacterium]|nr:response regulator [Planctomycetota bacterium]MCH8509362.1 response regulator [Phycisphaerales bacterium]